LSSPAAPKRWAQPWKPTKNSRELGRRAIARKKPTRKDVVVGIAASGRTPFTIAAVEYARAHGAKTVANRLQSEVPARQSSSCAIVAEVAPKWSLAPTRMKAGTAQKMILNMITTGAMTRLGYVYGNLMVNVSPKNEKLVERELASLEEAPDSACGSA